MCSACPAEANGTAGGGCFGNQAHDHAATGTRRVLHWSAEACNLTAGAAQTDQDRDQVS